MSKSVRDVLVEARELLAVADRWTQGAYSRGTSWCVVGSLRHCSGGSYMALSDAAQALRAGGMTTDLTGWNDTPERTHSEVLAAFDKAIAIAEAP